MKTQRILFGIIGAIFVVCGLSLFVEGDTSRQVLAGILSRVGFLLLSIWLAWPQLHTLKNRASMAVLGMIFAMLLLVAVRPKLFPIAFVAVIAGIFLNGIMRRFASSKKE